jgi:hypothetical protein
MANQITPDVPYSEDSNLFCPVADIEVEVSIDWLPYSVGFEDPIGFRCSGQSLCGIENCLGSTECPYDYYRRRLRRRRWL